MVGDVLTDEQQAVVDQPADALVLVTAGPGAGKTHTLVRRLDVLVDQSGLTSGEILVLSFSRAAVRELRSRLAGHGEAARHVRVQTFDSWALDLLMSLDTEGTWLSRGFDARIKGAVEAIKSGGADGFCEDLRHVVVDEVQDLVGTRRIMVEALLERFECGFTVVGDPSQAIYGFQVENPLERAYETNRFFARLKEIFGDDLVELALTKNFRVRDTAAELALPFARELCSSTGNNSSVYVRLRGVLRGSPLFGNLHDEYAKAALAPEDGTTAAVLCRSNGQAMLLSEDLHRAGVRHTLQRSARDRVVPAWIGRLFAADAGAFLTHSNFQDLISSLPLSENDEPNLLWDWLLRVTSFGRGNRTVDLRVLRSVLSAGRLPDELAEQQQAAVVVSSYHRAKGMEFDRVIVADPGTERDGADTDPAEEARALYVAMTRARDDVAWVETAGDRRVRKDKVLDRWARFGWKTWQRRGLELRGGDVSQEEPPGAQDFEARCSRLQDYLATEVRRADEVVLERLYEVPLGIRESPPYLVLHRGHPIATASRRFRKDLYVFLKTGHKDPWWPERIAGIRIDTVEAVAGSEAAGIEAGLGPHGVWLVPRLSGLSTFNYRSAGGPT